MNERDNEWDGNEWMNGDISPNEWINELNEQRKFGMFLSLFEDNSQKLNDRLVKWDIRNSG